jgi:hypothetical protein
MLARAAEEVGRSPMRRVEPATGTEGSAGDRAAFRDVHARLGGAFFTEKSKYPPSDLFGPLLHAPRVARGILELGGALRDLGEAGADGGSLTDDFAELIAFVVFARMHGEAVAQDRAFAYLRPMVNHVPRAIRSGTRPAAIRALVEGDDGALLPAERELAEFVRAVLAGSVDDGCWARMQARLGPRRTIETASYALLDFFVCRLEAALGLQDATREELDLLLKEST